MTDNPCPGRTTDKWRTVWECELERGHAQELCQVGVMMFRGLPSSRRSGETLTHALRARPVEFMRWHGAEDLDRFTEFFGDGVVKHEPLFDSLWIDAVVRGHPLRTGVLLFPGEWVVYWSDCAVESLSPDVFEAIYEEARHG